MTPPSLSANTEPSIECLWSKHSPAIKGDLQTVFWQSAIWLPILKQWNGMGAGSRGATFFAARWSNEFLYFGFRSQFKLLTMSDHPERFKKTRELWNKEDVVEVFIAPDPATINRYKEFEVSPSSQWIDIDLDRDRNLIDFEWASGMECQSHVDFSESLWQAELRIPLESLRLQTPAAGARLAVNVFRVELKSGLYLTWNPTLTPHPNFHVPSRFGRMVLTQ